MQWKRKSDSNVDYAQEELCKYMFKFTPPPSITLLPVTMIASDTRISQNCKILINTSPLCFEYKFCVNTDLHV